MNATSPSAKLWESATNIVLVHLLPATKFGEGLSQLIGKFKKAIALYSEEYPVA